MWVISLNPPTQYSWKDAFKPTTVTYKSFVCVVVVVLRTAALGYPFFFEVYNAIIISSSECRLWLVSYSINVHVGIESAFQFHVFYVCKHNGFSFLLTLITLIHHTPTPPTPPTPPHPPTHTHTLTCHSQDADAAISSTEELVFAMAP